MSSGVTVDRRGVQFALDRWSTLPPLLLAGKSPIRSGQTPNQLIKLQRPSLYSLLQNPGSCRQISAVVLCHARRAILAVTFGNRVFRSLTAHMSAQL
jgi:hypothetical protein